MSASAGAARELPARGARSRQPNANVGQLTPLVGSVRADRLSHRLDLAAEAYGGDRYEEARRILAPIVKEAPEFVPARELYGLSLYRLGRWKQAASQLEAFIDLTNQSTEQHPVLADCRRALKQYGEVERLWRELREASPGPELVNEGRIVAAGALADQGRLGEAVKVLSAGFRFPRSPRPDHLRRAYALADLYERSGDLLQARSMFERVAHFDDGSLDAAERARALG